MPPSLSAVLAKEGLHIAQSIPMAAKTTLQVGGSAAYWLDASNTKDITCAMHAAMEVNVPYYVIGNGSNLLIRDGGISGIMIGTAARMTEIAVIGRRIRAQSGARLSKMAMAAQAAALSGMEGIAGIPGTLGGALHMNAGSYGTEIADLVESVQLLDAHGHMHTLSAKEMKFQYRSSILMENNWVVVQATLLLQPGDSSAIGSAMHQYAMQRRNKQPLSFPSAGSFFKRPAGHYAGELIDHAGLKGLTVGGAQVSAMHAGFLINIGNATADDFLKLMELIQSRVLESSGIMLEPEVQILGCDSYY